MRLLFFFFRKRYVFNATFTVRGDRAGISLRLNTRDVPSLPNGTKSPTKNPFHLSQPFKKHVGPLFGSYYRMFSYSTTHN